MQTFADMCEPVNPARPDSAHHTDVLHRFDTFGVNDEQRRAIEDNRDLFQGTAAYILDATKPGREQSLALTALEEAKFWVNQSIAKDGVPA